MGPFQPFTAISPWVAIVQWISKTFGQNFWLPSMTLITDLSKHSCETLTINVTLLKDGCIKPKPTSDESGEDEVAATNRRRRCSFCARYGFVSLQFICYITVLPDVMDSNHAEISRRRGHFSLFMNQMN